MFPGIKSCRGYCPLVPIPDSPAERQILVLADIYAVISPGLKYGGQRDAAALAVAGLTSVRHIHDEIEIGYDADPVDVTWLVQNALDRNALVADDSKRLR